MASPVREPGIMRIKPHHFVDILVAWGEGTRAFAPHPYGHMLHAVAERAWRERDLTLEFTAGADEICTPCMHNIGGACDDGLDPAMHGGEASKGAYNRALDGRWMERLGLAEGQKMRAEDYCLLLRDRSGDIGPIYPAQGNDENEARKKALLKGVSEYLAR
jgi:hypothetical protein